MHVNEREKDRLKQMQAFIDEKEEVKNITRSRAFLLHYFGYGNSDSKSITLLWGLEISISYPKFTHTASSGNYVHETIMRTIITIVRATYSI